MNVAPLLVAAGLAAAAAAAWRLRSPAVEPARLPSRPAALPAPGARWNPLDQTSIAGTLSRLAATADGVRYSWGGGHGRRTWPQGGPGTRGGIGWDCSGLTLAALEALLRWRWDGPRLNSKGIAYACEPIADGRQQPGDIAYYPGHVVVVVGWPDPRTGKTAVLSASGGEPDVNGDNPNAVVKVIPDADYRDDRITYARPRPVDVDPEQAVTVMALHQLLAGRDPLPDARVDPARVRQLLRERYGGLPEVRRWAGAVA
jgi:hypothetical protein